MIYLTRICDLDTVSRGTGSRGHRPPRSLRSLFSASFSYYSYVCVYVGEYTLRRQSVLERKRGRDSRITTVRVISINARGREALSADGFAPRTFRGLPPQLRRRRDATKETS